MTISRIVFILVCGLVCVLASAPVSAQVAVAPSSSGPVGFTVPEWKSDNNEIIVRLRGRAVHDFYKISRDFDGTSRDGVTQNDDLRALRFGIDGQLSPKIRFRADANLTTNQINWADVYIGYVGTKFEVFIGQNYMAAPMETVENDPNFLLPEASLVNIAFAQSVRNFGAVVRYKRENWQIVGGLYHGNLNAGDIFGDDVLAYSQVRATYAPRHTDGDVLHFGINLRARDAQNGPLLRYATRPAATNFGPRLLDAGPIARRDTTLSFEAIYIIGSLMLSAEQDFLWAKTARGGMDIQGTDIEARWWLTGETRRYVVGTGSVAPVKPKRSLRSGGPGAIALVARYDHLDQSDPLFGASAGRVKAFSLGVAWIPVDFIMFRLAASKSQYSGGISGRNGTADVITARAQFSF